MKVLLINPPTISLFGGVSKFLKDVDIGHYPPLGIMYIASYLQKHSKHNVEIMDMMLDSLTEQELANEIIKRKPDVVGITATSFTVFNAREVCGIIKRADDKIKTVMGGPHVSIYPEETLNLREVDYVVMGESEEYFTKLIDAIQEKRVSEGIWGIGYKVNGKPHLNKRAKIVENLDSLPFPARELTSYKRYYSLIGTNSISTTIMTSRGCPYSCNFCYNQYKRRYRERSVANIITEIEECLKLGISEFFFFDELFTLNRRRVLDFCDEVIKRKLKIVFDLRSRVNTVDQEVLHKLKLAGCGRIQYGVESGTQEILDAMNKQITLEQVRQVVRSTKNVGITTFLDFMFAYPGETEEQIKKTIEFAFELDPDYVGFHATLLMPMTKIYEDALKSGFITRDFWKDMAKNPYELVDMPYAGEYSKEQIEKIVRSFYFKFYLRPSHIIKKLKKINSIAQIRRNIGAGLAMVKERIGI